MAHLEKKNHKIFQHQIEQSVSAYMCIHAAATSYIGPISPYTQMEDC